MLSTTSLVQDCQIVSSFSLQLYNWTSKKNPVEQTKLFVYFDHVTAKETDFRFIVNAKRNKKSICQINTYGTSGYGELSVRLRRY